MVLWIGGEDIGEAVEGVVAIGGPGEEPPAATSLDLWAAVPVPALPGSTGPVVAPALAAPRLIAAVALPAPGSTCRPWSQRVVA
jgi:hypothetical protein